MSVALLRSPCLPKFPQFTDSLCFTEETEETEEKRSDVHAPKFAKTRSIQGFRTMRARHIWACVWRAPPTEETEETETFPQLFRLDKLRKTEVY